MARRGEERRGEERWREARLGSYRLVENVAVDEHYGDALRSVDAARDRRARRRRVDRACTQRAQANAHLSTAQHITRTAECERTRAPSVQRCSKWSHEKNRIESSRVNNESRLGSAGSGSTLERLSWQHLF